MTEEKKLWLVVVLGVAGLLVGIAMTIHNWGECREAGFSILYCIQQLG